MRGQTLIFCSFKNSCINLIILPFKSIKLFEQYIQPWYYIHWTAFTELRVKYKLIELTYILYTTLVHAQAVICELYSLYIIFLHSYCTWWVESVTKFQLTALECYTLKVFSPLIKLARNIFVKSFKYAAYCVLYIVRAKFKYIYQYDRQRVKSRCF